MELDRSTPISEARRRQNREAQKRWRAKQRRKATQSWVSCTTDLEGNLVVPSKEGEVGELLVVPTETMPTLLDRIRFVAENRRDQSFTYVQNGEVVYHTLSPHSYDPYTVVHRRVGVPVPSESGGASPSTKDPMVYAFLVEVCRHLDCRPAEWFHYDGTVSDVFHYKADAALATLATLVKQGRPRDVQAKVETAWGQRCSDMVASRRVGKYRQYLDRPWRPLFARFAALTISGRVNDTVIGQRGTNSSGDHTTPSWLFTGTDPLDWRTHTALCSIRDGVFKTLMDEPFAAELL